MFEYSGAIHIHSLFSDGSSSVEDIARFANEVDLDFIILTDHNTLGAKEKKFEKWHNNVLVIVGCEINDINNRNHYLVMGLDKLIGEYIPIGNGEKAINLNAKDYISLFKQAGAAGFIAHPFEKRNHKKEHPPYPWDEWSSDSFDGIEIWNHMSEWIEGLTDKSKYQRFFHPLKSISAPDVLAVKKWDEINLKRKLSAIGSVDAHAHKQKIMGYEFIIFPYKILFKSIRTHVFVENEIHINNEGKSFGAISDIIDALKCGHSFIVNCYYGSGKGFRYFAEYNEKVYLMGDDIIICDKEFNVKLKAFLPKSARLKLFRNGLLLDESSGMSFNWDIFEKGNYRVEAWIKNKAWIFSNNIRVL